MTTQTPTANAVSFTLPPRINLAAACAGPKEKYGASSAFQGALVSKPGVGLGVILDTTNGKIAARLWLSGSATDGASAIIPAALLKAAPARGTTTLHVAGSNCTREHEGTTTAGTCIDGTFPPIADVYPPIARLAGADYHFLQVNPKLIADLAEAIGAREKLALFIPKDAKQPVVAVFNAGDNDGIGLLCPLSSTGDNRISAERTYEALTPNRDRA